MERFVGSGADKFRSWVKWRWKMMEKKEKGMGLTGTPAGGFDATIGRTDWVGLWESILGRTESCRSWRWGLLTCFGE